MGTIIITVSLLISMTAAQKPQFQSYDIDNIKNVELFYPENRLKMLEKAKTRGLPEILQTFLGKDGGLEYLIWNTYENAEEIVLFSTILSRLSAAVSYGYYVAQTFDRYGYYPKPMRILPDMLDLCGYPAEMKNEELDAYEKVEKAVLIESFSIGLDAYQAYVKHKGSIDTQFMYNRSIYDLFLSDSYNKVRKKLSNMVTVADKRNPDKRRLNANYREVEANFRKFLSNEEAVKNVLTRDLQQVINDNRSRYYELMEYYMDIPVQENQGYYQSEDINISINTGIKHEIEQGCLFTLPEFGQKTGSESNCWIIPDLWNEFINLTADLNFDGYDPFQKDVVTELYRQYFINFIFQKYKMLKNSDEAYSEYMSMIEDDPYDSNREKDETALDGVSPVLNLNGQKYREFARGIFTKTPDEFYSDAIVQKNFPEIAKAVEKKYAEGRSQKYPGIAGALAEIEKVRGQKFSDEQKASVDSIYREKLDLVEQEIAESRGLRNVFQKRWVPLPLILKDKTGYDKFKGYPEDGDIMEVYHYQKDLAGRPRPGTVDDMSNKPGIPLEMREPLISFLSIFRPISGEIADENIISAEEAMHPAHRGKKSAQTEDYVNCKLLSGMFLEWLGYGHIVDKLDLPETKWVKRGIAEFDKYITEYLRSEADKACYDDLSLADYKRSPRAEQEKYERCFNKVHSSLASMWNKRKAATAYNKWENMARKAYNRELKQLAYVPADKKAPRFSKAELESLMWLIENINSASLEKELEDYHRSLVTVGLGVVAIVTFPAFGTAGGILLSVVAAVDASIYDYQSRYLDPAYRGKSDSDRAIFALQSGVETLTVATTYPAFATMVAKAYAKSLILKKVAKTGITKTIRQLSGKRFMAEMRGYASAGAHAFLGRESYVKAVEVSGKKLGMEYVANIAGTLATKFAPAFAQEVVIFTAAMHMSGTALVTARLGMNAGLEYFLDTEKLEESLVSGAQFMLFLKFAVGAFSGNKLLLNQLHMGLQAHILTRGGVELYAAETYRAEGRYAEALPHYGASGESLAMTATAAVKVAEAKAREAKIRKDYFDKKAKEGMHVIRENYPKLVGEYRNFINFVNQDQIDLIYESHTKVKPSGTDGTYTRLDRRKKIRIMQKKNQDGSEILNKKQRELAIKSFLAGEKPGPEGGGETELQHEKPDSPQIVDGTPIVENTLAARKAYVELVKSVDKEIDALKKKLARATGDTEREKINREIEAKKQELKKYKEVRNQIISDIEETEKKRLFEEFEKTLRRKRLEAGYREVEELDPETGKTVWVWRKTDDRPSTPPPPKGKNAIDGGVLDLISRMVDEHNITKGQGTELLELLENTSLLGTRKSTVYVELETLLSRCNGEENPLLVPRFRQLLERRNRLFERLDNESLEILNENVDRKKEISHDDYVELIDAFGTEKILQNNDALNTKIKQILKIKNVEQRQNVLKKFIRANRSKYYNAVLVRLKSGEEVLCYADMFYEHRWIIKTIKEQFSEGEYADFGKHKFGAIEEILWAGELERKGNLFLRGNETAGIIRRPEFKPI
ncbi:MAG: hypothetical protein JXA66_02375, partial [Oligoflexia bacterium]|nr:hypothetical protein [Oligoflexia bacterium]